MSLETSKLPEEVLEEALEHQFFFTPTNNVASIEYNDTDADGNPIGLDISFQTENATVITQIMTVTLRHEPNKDAEGVSDGDIANAEAGLAVLAAFFAIMSLGVWYVFRKRGRIYI